MIEGILEIHTKLYPLMQPTDAVKLVYQNEFGIGHLIVDDHVFANHLCKEMSETEPKPNVPLTVPIGNGLVRVMLNSPDISGISPGKLIECCLFTAAAHKGSMEQFEQKLSELEDACVQGLFGFTSRELTTYLTMYHEEGCPAVSHSKIYHNAYHPAYRVIFERCVQSL